MTPRKTQTPEPIESESVATDDPSRHLGITPDEIGALPALPGVYIMRDAAGAALYIGKALNLHARVHSRSVQSRLPTEAHRAWASYQVTFTSG